MTTTKLNQYATLVGAITMTLVTASCATTRTVGQQLDDATVTARVGHRLTMDPDIPRHEIDVDTLHGVVTLRGEVPDEAVRQEALEVASRTRGVVSVRDDLRIAPERKGSGPDGDLGITARVNNRLIADPDIRATDVDVDTYDGVVTLSGLVATDHARQEAELVARQTKGVRAVRNELGIASDGAFSMQ
jgi:hyperosmotically inducible protein